jgi:PAS domain S-box-containing protein
MEKLYKEDLVDFINDIQFPVWIYDYETYRFLAVNKSAVKMLGYSHYELLNMTILDIRSYEELDYFHVHKNWKVHSCGLYKYYRLKNKENKEILAGISKKEITYRKKRAVISSIYDLTEIIGYDQKLRKSEELFRVSQEISLDGFIMLKAVRDEHNEIKDLHFEYVNPVASMFFGHPVKGGLTEYLPYHNKLFTACKEVIENDISKDIEIRHSSPNGDKWLRYMIVKLHDGAAVSFLDITQRKMQQVEIENKNKELNNILERISEAFVAFDINWNLTYMNNAAMHILNSERSIIGSNLWELFPMFKNSPLQKNLQKAMDEQQSITFDIEGTLNPRWYRISAFPSPEGLSIYATDITLSRAYEEQLLSSLKQKETLLKEVHHRIKNNLQIIISILNLQSYYIKDPKALDTFKQSQNRIRSMALIHEKLYKTDNLSSVNLQSYVADVVRYLSSSYAVTEEKINVILDMANIELDSNTAISFGLIVNELVSNSLKYAFPSGQKGTVKLEARKDESKIIFSVSDNGVGLPYGMDINDTNSLGMQLVNTLIDQLNGELEYKSDQGAKFEIHIPYSK